MSKEEVKNEIDKIPTSGAAVEVVDVTEGGVVKINLLGTCARCSNDNLGIVVTIEKGLKEKIPEVERVETV